MPALAAAGGGAAGGIRRAAAAGPPAGKSRQAASGIARRAPPNRLFARGLPARHSRGPPRALVSPCVSEGASPRPSPSGDAFLARRDHRSGARAAELPPSAAMPPLPLHAELLGRRAGPACRGGVASAGFFAAPARRSAIDVGIGRTCGFRERRLADVAVGPSAAAFARATAVGLRVLFMSTGAPHPQLFRVVSGKGPPRFLHGGWVWVFSWVLRASAEVFRCWSVKPPTFRRRTAAVRQCDVFGGTVSALPPRFASTSVLGEVMGRGRADPAASPVIIDTFVLVGSTCRRGCRSACRGEGVADAVGRGSVEDRGRGWL